MDGDAGLQTKSAQICIFQTSQGHFREVSMEYERYLALGSQSLRRGKKTPQLTRGYLKLIC